MYIWRGMEIVGGNTADQRERPASTTFHWLTRTLPLRVTLSRATPLKLRPESAAVRIRGDFRR
jgi:hypothetical protein